MTPHPTTLRLERLIKAPVTRVFAAWTTPHEIARWIGTGDWKTTDASIDLRVGGEYRIQMENAGRHIEMCGVYREVQPPERLVFTWRQEGDPMTGLDGETLVTVDLVSVTAGTEVHLTHAGFTDDAIREEHAEGWAICCDEMERIVAEDRPAA